MAQHTTQPIDFSTIQRVLVTKLRFHGDVLLSSPVFQVLKKYHPHLRIDALIYEETKDMLSLHPAIDQIFTIDKNWRELNPWQQIHYERQLLKKLSTRHYDIMIHLTEHWRGFYLKHLLNIPYAVTAQYRRRNHNWLWQQTFTHIYPVPSARNKAASHIDALRFIGINALTKEEQTSLAISACDKEFVQQLIKQHGLKSKNFILVHPTSRFFYKCCPPQIIARVINRLTNKQNQVVVTAAPNKKEALYIEEMMKSISSPITNLSGKLSLKQLGAIIQQSRCFVGVDSAPMHIAAAVNTPIVALFGPTDTDVWGPQSDHCTVIQSTNSKKPTLTKGKRPNNIENCTVNIDVDTIFKAISKQGNLF